MLACRSAAGPAVDEEAERAVQPVRLAEPAARASHRRRHRQHNGPSGAHYDESRLQSTGEDAATVCNSLCVLVPLYRTCENSVRSASYRQLLTFWRQL